VSDLSTREVAMEAEWEFLRKMHEDLLTRELTITSQESALECHAIALTSKERASQQGEVARGCRAPGTGYHAQDGGGAIGGMGG
jgi:hypothetical protein